MIRRPLCRWIVLSDRVETDEDGFVSLLRIFNLVEIEALSKVAGPLTVTTYWENGPPRGEVEFFLQFHWPKGRVEDGPRTKAGFGVTGRGYGIVDFPQFVYHDYGDLEVRVLREGEVQNATLLTVMPMIESLS